MTGKGKRARARDPLPDRAIMRSTTAIRLWLWIVAGMILAMVVVGGATRLTESGLSITEWKPISGVLPPLSEAGLAGGIRALPCDPAIFHPRA